MDSMTLKMDLHPIKSKKIYNSKVPGRMAIVKFGAKNAHLHEDNNVDCRSVCA